MDVSAPAELQKAPSKQAAIKYKITLLDRRSNAVIGTYTYVVDRVNKRACGANVENVISADAFVYDAVNR